MKWHPTFLHSAGFPHLNETGWSFVPVWVHYCDCAACEDFFSFQETDIKLHNMLFARHYVEDTRGGYYFTTTCASERISNTATQWQMVHFMGLVMFNFCRGADDSSLWLFLMLGLVLLFFFRTCVNSLCFQRKEENTLLCLPSDFWHVTWKNVIVTRWPYWVSCVYALLLSCRSDHNVCRRCVNMKDLAHWHFCLKCCRTLSPGDHESL